MPFEIISEHLNGIKVIGNITFEDERGSFTEMYREDLFADMGIKNRFCQENLSISKKGVIRGLHFQWKPKMGKLMRVISGKAFLVAVDIRRESPTLGKWFGMEIGMEDNISIWATPGFARGFYSLMDNTGIQYLCTSVYEKENESGIRWNDTELKIDWPGDTPVLSEKDRNAQTFLNWMNRPESYNFIYKQ